MDLHAKGISFIIPTYRDTALAIACVNSLQKTLNLYESCDEIVVVDDGSGNDSASKIIEAFGETVTLVALDENLGRTAARNAGAQRARGKILLFIDADCLVATSDFAKHHRRAIESGNIASIGAITGAGSGFWHRYQQESSERREHLFKTGVNYIGSTQNLAVLRSAFLNVGGFDSGYVEYGFEDRDLLLRLAHTGSIAWTADALVQHMDELSLSSVSRKMVGAGSGNAWRFQQQHPEAYRRLGYAALDCRIHSWLRPFAKLAGPCLPWLSLRLNSCLESGRLPWPMRKMMVKLISALSFAYGTSRPLN